MAASASSPTRSLAYAKAMGIGWNLGNSFDAVGDNGGNTVTIDYAENDRGTRSWRNPAPTRDFIHAIAAKGYSTLRLPFTVLRRFHQETAKDGTTHWIIDPAWLHAYRQVVDWGLAEGMHVVINIHHDSWLWLARFHGDRTAPEYRAFCDMWSQLAREFADEPDALAFETINEPRFVDKKGAKIEDDSVTQPFIDAINKAAYDAIRAVPGNEHRMIILATLDMGFEPHSRLAALRDFIKKDLKNDPDVLASVHYYSQWLFSGSLGRTGFDEPLVEGKPDTPRTHLRRFADAIDACFTREGIGTFIGEWGLLGYDTASDGALQQGEELKYYDEFLATMREHGFSCAFWDNGTGIDRQDAAHGYPWRKPLVGAVMQAGLTGRSACAKGLDTVYVTADSVIRVPLSLHGRRFVSVRDGRGPLQADTDYRFDNENGRAVLVLDAEYVRRLRQMKGTDGLLADLDLHFDGGADWHELLVQAGTPALLHEPTSVAAALAGCTENSLPEDGIDRTADDKAALAFHPQQTTRAFWQPVNGSRTAGIRLPMRFAGNELKSVAARKAFGSVNGTFSDPRASWLGPQAGYWHLLQNGGAYAVHYDNADRLTGSITLLPAFFDCPSVKAFEGPIVLFCRFQSGKMLRVRLLLGKDGTVQLG